MVVGVGGFASVDLGLALNLVNLALNSSGEEFRDGLNCGSGVPRPEDLRCLVRRQCFFVLQLGQVLTVDDQLVASARGGSGLVRSGGEAVLATSLIPVESPPIKEESADIRGVGELGVALSRLAVLEHGQEPRGVSLGDLGEVELVHGHSHRGSQEQQEILAVVGVVDVVAAIEVDLQVACLRYVGGPDSEVAVGVPDLNVVAVPDDGDDVGAELVPAQLLRQVVDLEEEAAAARFLDQPGEDGGVGGGVDQLLLRPGVAPPEPHQPEAA